MKYLLQISIILLLLPVVYSFEEIGLQEGIIISPNITFTPSILNVSKLKFPETPIDIEKSIATDKNLIALEQYLKDEPYDQVPSEIVELGESEYTSLNKILSSLEIKRREDYTKNKPATIKINFEDKSTSLEIEKDVKIQIDFVKENNLTRPKVNIILNPEYSHYKEKSAVNPKEDIIEETKVVNIINIFVIINIILFVIILITTDRKKIIKFFSKRS